MLDDFFFGTATSAYQIEGAWKTDGKAPSIWDEISHGKTKFHVQNNHTGDIACDHYHKWDSDVELLKILGVKAYRFSISWSRICTQKNICSNLKGIKFYQELVDKLIEYDIEPFVTLYHWDLPKWMDELGGWSNKNIIKYWKAYVETMQNALPDVKYWITFNEPAVFVRNYWGHKEMSKAIKNVLLAHGEACEILDTNNVGISLNLIQVYPYVYDDKNNQLAVDNLNKIHNEIWLDPILKGELPENINQLYEFLKPIRLNKDEKQKISYPIDFLGLNYYSTVTVKYVKRKPHYEQVHGDFKTDLMGVAIRPWGIYSLTTDYLKKYKDKDIYITENGCACSDTHEHDGRIHDVERIDYIRKHLRSCNNAIKNGGRIKGYFYWSFMDNFEWLYGYNKRFGLVYIFYPTTSRLCKDSYYYYQKIIKDKKFRDKELAGKII